MKHVLLLYFFCFGLIARAQTGNDSTKLAAGLMWEIPVAFSTVDAFTFIHPYNEPTFIVQSNRWRFGLGYSLGYLKLMQGSYGSQTSFKLSYALLPVGKKGWITTFFNIGSYKMQGFAKGLAWVNGASTNKDILLHDRALLISPGMGYRINFPDKEFFLETGIGLTCAFSRYRNEYTFLDFPEMNYTERQKITTVNLGIRMGIGGTF